MSADTDRRELERIDRDILACEKKIADCDKKIATAESRANDAQKAISRTKSASTISSKMRQIEGYNRDKQRAMDDKTREQTKLTGLRKKRIDAQTKLQKSEAAEAKKAAEATKKSQDRMRAAYEGQIAALNSEIQALKATPVIPAGQPDHIYAQTGTEEYDVFISHATEDKATFVDEFVRILKDVHHLKVWYDKDVLQWGDSIRARIDEGLLKSKVGVVVLSRHYMKKYWTSYEYEGLINRESMGGKIVLPIWHDITKAEVMAYSPTLAGKMAMLTAIMAPGEIADALVAVLDAGKPQEEEING